VNNGYINIRCRVHFSRNISQSLVLLTVSNPFDVAQD